MNPHLLTTVTETPFFEGLSSERAHRAASAFCVRTYERGETISGAADTDARTYVMADGVGRSVHVNQDGRCLTNGLIETGSVFGRLPYLDDGHTEQVEALVNCQVLRASTADIEALASVDPIIARNLVRSNAQRLRGVEARLASLTFQPVPGRLAHVIIELADHFGKVTVDGVRIDVRMTHGALAEMTSTTRETLTKVSGWLRTEGIASIERRLIWVADWDALVAVEEGKRCMPGRTSKA